MDKAHKLRQAEYTIDRTLYKIHILYRIVILCVSFLELTYEYIQRTGWAGLQKAASVMESILKR
jgi:hypothetical protein